MPEVMATVSDPVSDSFPNINEWPRGAVQPILDRIVRWNVFGPIQVVVPTLTGRKYQVCVGRKELVRDLRKKITNAMGHDSPTALRLIFRGAQLLDDTPIATTGIEHNSVVHCVLRLRGGGVGKNPE